MVIRQNQKFIKRRSKRNTHKNPKRKKKLKKIEVINWKEPEMVDGQMQDVKYDTMKILSLLINFVPPQDQPKGRDNFKLMAKINDAFTKVEEHIDSGAEPPYYLFLEDNEYQFFRNLYDKFVPAAWGRSKKITEALEKFEDAETVDPNEPEKKEKTE